MHEHCESIREKMTEFIVGALDAGPRAEVEAHCATCSACRAELDAIRAVSALLERELTAESVPLELSAARRARLSEMARAGSVSQASNLESDRSSSRRAAWLRWAIPLAAAAMLVLVFSFVLRTDRDSFDEIASIPETASPMPQEDILHP